jgi:hypothetical protein
MLIRCHGWLAEGNVHKPLTAPFCATYLSRLVYILDSTSEQESSWEN